MYGTCARVRRAVVVVMVSGAGVGRGWGFFQVSSKTSSFSPAVRRRAPCPLSISWQKGSSVWLPADNREGEEVFKEVHVINDCSCIILAFFLRCRAPPPPPLSCPENNGGELFQACGGGDGGGAS